MNILRATLHERSMSFTVDDMSCAIPVGVLTLAEGLVCDPPSPEELTNAIGLVQDHLEDASRELPMFEFAERVEVAGHGVGVVAAIEVGAPPPLPFELPRGAAEDVFRTLVTERRADRRLNPGLPEPMVHEVLGSISALVALMRFLQSDSVWVIGE